MGIRMRRVRRVGSVRDRGSPRLRGLCEVPWRQPCVTPLSMRSSERKSRNVVVILMTNRRILHNIVVMVPTFVLKRCENRVASLARHVPSAFGP